MSKVRKKVLLKGGQDLSKIESLGGFQNFCLKGGDKPEKGGVDVEMGGLPLFYYFIIQVYVWEK